MRIRELQIFNFRNLRYIRGEFPPGLTLLHGSNAQGKTNILEAVYQLVTGRSFRTTNERELIPWVRDDYEATLVRACVVRQSGEERFILSFNQNEKNIFVNGNPIRKLGELIGRINAVLFTPADLELVRGGPATRRRFLDIGISQVNHPYLLHLQRYDLALRQRNALLKRHQGRASLKDELNVWDAQLVEHGAELTFHRARTIAELSALAGGMYRNIAGAAEPLMLVYKPSPRIPDTANPSDIRAGLLEQLLSAREDDIRRGATSVGPHRDDFLFLINDKDARDFGSQGQQRSCVLSVKLAELRLMQQATGEAPLLLLDDLMSELDESRKRAFLEALDPGVQTFLTATEAELVTPYVAPAAIFAVDEGELKPGA